MTNDALLPGHSSTICEVCKNYHEFEMPADLKDDLYKGNLAIFAGAGVSTERKLVLPYTLYDDIAQELNLGYSNISFPSLMSKYCEQVNGRIKLLSRIKQRFQYFESFPELYNRATEFHNELASLFQIEIIVTTNWDTYFEERTAATPFVTPDDLALWNSPGRKVLKIHGSINNYGSIVATDEDYQSCLDNLQSGLLGSTLKFILATKTILFVGYSLSDYDFVNIHSFIRKEMKSLARHAYIVTLDTTSDVKFKGLGLIPIHTDATYFIHVLKAHAVHDGQLMSDEHYSYAAHVNSVVVDEHKRLYTEFNCQDHPEVIYAASYQDGLAHAFGHFMSIKSTGYYNLKSNIEKTIQDYRFIRQDRLREKNYWDVAYIDGYINAHIALLLDNEGRAELPIYYVFGVRHQPRTFSEYRDTIKDAKTLHKTSYEQARKTIQQRTAGDSQIVAHHPPFL
jgi:hypothetical protein